MDLVSHPPAEAKMTLPSQPKSKIAMPPENESQLETGKPRRIGQRLAGVFFGGISGLILSVLLFLLLDFCGVVSGYNPASIRFVFCGVIIGCVLGFIFPRPLIAIGSILGNLIPGF